MCLKNLNFLMNIYRFETIDIYFRNLNFFIPRSLEKSRLIAKYSTLPLSTHCGERDFLLPYASVHFTFFKLYVDILINIKFIFC